MNVFVLCTGRCGSMTFAKACEYMSNYTSTHETNNRWLHEVKHPYRCLSYGENHIEIDNRLSWFLGTLDKAYGDRAFYVHLLRRREEVAESLIGRGRRSILFSFSHGILQHYDEAERLSDRERYQIGLQYWDTVNDNIDLFLRNKSHKMVLWLHDIKDPFRSFWEEIGAQGDVEAAVAEWDMRHNVTKRAGA
jgi:hypothetical protein